MPYPKPSIRPALVSRTLALPTHSPKRTQPEPTKRHGETNGNRDSPGSRMPGCVLHILADPRGAAEGGHRQKHGASHFQPQLVHRAAERSSGGAYTAHQRAEQAVA